MPFNLRDTPQGIVLRRCRTRRILRATLDNAEKARCRKLKQPSERKHGLMRHIEIYLSNDRNHHDLHLSKK